MSPFCFLRIISVISLVVTIFASAEDDVACLRGFKSAVSNPNSYISSWNFSNSSTGSICSFIGVQCQEDNSIISLSLPFSVLWGPVPSELSLCSSIVHLDLSRNSLWGPIPSSLCSWFPNLTTLDLSSNSLSGPIPSNLSGCRFLDSLDLSGNSLSGPIPSALSLCSAVKYLDLSGNSLSGPIPSSLCSWLPNLATLDLSSNSLSGLIPSNVSGCRFLYSLDLSGNHLSGPIPSALSLCSRIEYLNLSGNSLSGPIPSSLCSWLPNFTTLDLSSNSLFGPIPSNLSGCRFLHSLDLSRNRLSGPIPSELPLYSSIEYLGLSGNSFSGPIPSSLCSSLPNLTTLDLSSNSLPGAIPSNLSDCRFLKYLNLSHNRLSGPIPSAVYLCSFIIILDLSGNSLCGQIPDALHSRFNPSAFSDNPDLSSGSCSKSSSKTRLIIIIAVGVLGVMVSLVVIHVFYSRRKSKLKVSPDTNVPHLNHYRVISQYELIRATENFSETNLVGRGCFGSVFMGCLDDGLIVAIKVLNLDVEGSFKSFEAECQVLRTVRHKNIVKIMNVCSNLDFKALILEYMPNGSLERWLHSDNYFLNLLERLNIMVDVSLALEYLHHHLPQAVLHCDLKPTNILLDEKLVAHVSDFGIAKLLLGDSKLAATTSMPGTIGYIAPEYATTGAVSRMGDVYSFGILLLETFTKKTSINATFDGQSSLREWIFKAHSNRIVDIVDESILKYHREDDQQKLLRCLSSLIKLGLLCSKYLPKDRIPMTDVVIRLQKIKIEYLSR